MVVEERRLAVIAPLRKVVRRAHRHHPSQSGHIVGSNLTYLPRKVVACPRLSPEVRNALDKDDDGAISAEVTRLVAGYTMLMKACDDRHGVVSPEVLLIKVRWPIERVAVLMLVEFLESEAGLGDGRFTLH